MPYKGDQGELVFRRTTAVEGSEPPAAKPLRHELGALAKTTPSTITSDASAFLGGYGVVNPTCELGDDAPLILLGEPRLVQRGSARLVVSRVLNAEIKEWGLLRSVPSASDNGSFDDQTTAPGFYSGDPLKGQFFVHSESDGRDFYDYITAAVLDFGIVFNTHSPGYAQSVYHEILHTFEGKNLSGGTYLKEGFVERFADLFMKGSYGLAAQIYSPYAKYVSEVDKLIRYADHGLYACAKAYFDDDVASLEEFVPCCYEPIRATQQPEDQISDECQQEMAGLSAVKNDLLGRFAMKKAGSWYRRWVTGNNGQVPPNGLSL